MTTETSHRQSTIPKSSIQKVVHDVIELFELQLELLSVDSQAAKRKLTRAGICAGIAAILGGSALTVVLVGGGLLLREVAGLPPGVGLLIVGLISFCIVGLLGAIGLIALKGAAAALDETKSELTENLRWLKATLIAPQSSARNLVRGESFPGSGTDAPSAQTRGGSATEPPHSRTRF